MSPLCPSRPMKPTSWPRKCRRVRTECGYTVVYKENPEKQCRAYSWIGWHVGLMHYIVHTVYISLSNFGQHNLDDIFVRSFNEDKSNHNLMLKVLLETRWYHLQLKVKSPLFFNLVWWSVLSDLKFTSSYTIQQQSLRTESKHFIYSNSTAYCMEVEQKLTVFLSYQRS